MGLNYFSLRIFYRSEASAYRADLNFPAVSEKLSKAVAMGTKNHAILFWNEGLIISHVFRLHYALTRLAYHGSGYRSVTDS